MLMWEGLQHSPQTFSRNFKDMSMWQLSFEDLVALIPHPAYRPLSFTGTASPHHPSQPHSYPLILTGLCFPDFDELFVSSPTIHPPSLRT